MSPTTREVEAARVERMRRAAAQRAAAPAPKPANPRDRRRAELEAAHKAANAPNRWACRLDGCPVAHIWHPTAGREESLKAAHAHYMTRHYNPDPPYALRGLNGDATPLASTARPARPPAAKPLGSPPTARQQPRQRPPRSTWDERTEPTWIDRM